MVLEILITYLYLDERLSEMHQRMPLRSGSRFATRNLVNTQIGALKNYLARGPIFQPLYNHSYQFKPGIDIFSQKWQKIREIEL